MRPMQERISDRAGTGSRGVRAVRPLDGCAGSAAAECSRHARPSGRSAATGCSRATGCALCAGGNAGYATSDPVPFGIRHASDPIADPSAGRAGESDGRAAVATESAGVRSAGSGGESASPCTRPRLGHRGLPSGPLGEELAGGHASRRLPRGDPEELGGVRPTGRLRAGPQHSLFPRCPERDPCEGAPTLLMPLVDRAHAIGYISGVEVASGAVQSDGLSHYGTGGSR